MRLENKTAIVTGSGRGIGKYIAKRLGREGANVVVTARTEADIEKVYDEISYEGGKAVYVKGDVTREADVRAVIAKAVNTFGQIDILVNNAGVGLRKFLRETEEEEYDEVMVVNVKGVFLFMKNIMPKMEKNGGTIINISSGAGKEGIPTLAVYCASKFAVIGLTEASAREVGKNIRIVALCPSSVNEGMFRRLFPGEKADLEPEEVAEKVADICINPAKYRQGQSIELH